MLDEQKHVRVPIRQHRRHKCFIISTHIELNKNIKILKYNIIHYELYFSLNGRKSTIFYVLNQNGLSILYTLFLKRVICIHYMYSRRKKEGVTSLGDVRTFFWKEEK